MHGNAYTVRNALKRKAQNPKSDFILRSQSFILKSAKRENFRDRRFFRDLLREIRNLRVFRRVNPSMKKSKLQEFSRRESTSRTANEKCFLLFLQTFREKDSLAILENSMINV